MANKADSFYFENFAAAAAVSAEAAAKVNTIISGFSAAELPKQMEQLHELEHRGDTIRHGLVNKLISAFMTPIERDDIIALASCIDDITDSIEDIVIQIYVTATTHMRDDAPQFAALLSDCCNAVSRLVSEFGNFKKSKEIANMVIEINNIEEQGDRLYHQAMRRLHTESHDPIEIIAWRSIYSLFETAIDNCEDAAEIVEKITIGNI